MSFDSIRNTKRKIKENEKLPYIAPDDDLCKSENTEDFTGLISFHDDEKEVEGKLINTFQMT